MQFSQQERNETKNLVYLEDTSKEKAWLKLIVNSCRLIFIFN